MKRFFALIFAAILTLPLVWSCTEEQETPNVKVQSISIEQGDLTLEEGESVNLTATVLPEDATDKTVSWSSSNDEIVMVSSNGKAKAMAIGEATVTAKAGDKSDFITITVVAKTIPVTGITLNPSSITLKVGESQTITADVTPQNATDKNVIWKCSNPEVVSVNNGFVTGLNPGSVTITATTVNGGKTADCSVTVKAELAQSITVGAEQTTAVSVVLKGKVLLDGVVPDVEYGFVYSTSAAEMVANPIVLKAANLGTDSYYSLPVPGLMPETVYYYRSFLYKDGNNYYGETKSFTTKELASLLETQEASEVDATTAKLNAKLDLTDVQYSTIEYGFFWGTLESSQDISLKGDDIDDYAFTAALSNLSHKTEYWYKAYVKLDSQTFIGEVKCFTTAVVPVESISLDKTEYTFHTIDGTLMLTATVLPSDATYKSVEWSSDNEKVATVDSNGEVTAKGNGKAIITVKANEQGKTATCEVTVAQWVTSISLNKTLLPLVIGGEVRLTVTSVLPENANDKSYTWTSSDNTVASVDNSGKVTAKSKGKTTINVTANDGSGVFASCRVTVKSVLGPCPSGAVDLGLSVYWATSNLSTSGLCENPQDYGDYYAWGETATKIEYKWRSYKWCGGSSKSLTKYNTSSEYGTVDNKTELVPEDDVAYVKLGGKWRMPTDAEWTELLENCTWTRTSNYDGTGVEGVIVTSNKTGYTSRSIFLPAAGCRSAGLANAGYAGYYWSSSLLMSKPESAWLMYFDSDRLFFGSLIRPYGLSVRPVSE